MLDVRTEGEFEGNTAQGAVNIPLARLDSLLHLLNRYVIINFWNPLIILIPTIGTIFLSHRDQNYLAFCLGGFRSTIAASILTSQGFKVQDIDKGFASISVNASQLTTTGKVSV